VTGDPPRRWADDSPEENFEAHRAAELARNERWTAEQKLRPLTDALAEHGVQPGDTAESWASLILPGWWGDVAEPGAGCPWCQRPGLPSPCPDCRAAREQAGDPAAAWTYWANCTPAQRRLHIAARFGTDPWTGRRATITAEWADTTPERISTTRHRYIGTTPDGIYWAARRQA
jgi:hypothetical protein